MSAALTVLGSLACLLVSALFIALAVLARVERNHEQAVGIRTEDRPVREGTSADIHLFLGFPASTRLDAKYSGAPRAFGAEEAKHAFAELARSVEGATHGHADFGRFQPISIRPVDGVSFVYLHVRTRRALPTFVGLAERERYVATLNSLAALDDAAFIDVQIGGASEGTDPSFGRPSLLG